MSDSDDTDLLLLIPPDFFAVDSSESEDSFLPPKNGSLRHFHFDKLISQVNALEDRVNFIECKDNVTSENLSEASRLNHSIDYSLSYDSSKYRNIFGGDLALRFYSLTSHGFNFGNNNSNDVPYIEPVEFNSCPNVIMPYQNSANVNSEKSIENAPSLRTNDLRAPNIDPTRASCSLPSRSSMTIDCVPMPNGKYKSRNTHRLLPNPSYHHFTFLNEIDEYLEGKYKENVNERLLPSFIANTQIAINKDECNTESIQDHSSDNSKLPIVANRSSSELYERTNLDLNQVDKLLHEVEANNLDVKNKLKPSFPSFGALKTADERSGFKCYSAVPKQSITNNYNGNVIKCSSSSDINPSRVCDELFEKSNKVSEHYGKQSDKSNEHCNFIEIEASRTEQFTDRKVNSVDALKKTTEGSKFVSPTEEYYVQEKRPILESYHELSNAANGKEISSQLCGQALGEKFQIENDESSTKHRQFTKHIEEQFAPKLSSSSMPAETLSSVHTNSESISGNTSVHRDGRNKNLRPLVPDEGYFSSVGTCLSAGNLLSLSDLWGKEKKPHQVMDVLSMEHKLQEELCRRKHCEGVILELQSTVLELQQKLSIAVRVDQSKDNTIHQLQSAWKRLASHWQELEEQRNALSIQCSEEKEKYQKDISEMIQKIKWYENEVSKALTVAQGYKEKNDMLEQKIKLQERTFADERKALEDSVAEEKKNLSETKMELSNICCEMDEIKRKLEIVEKEAIQDKELTLKAQDEVKTGKKALEKLTSNLVSVKEENNSLHLSLKEEKAKNEIGNLQIKNLQATLDESIKKEKLLTNEIKEKVSLLEKTRSDLRNFYQQQVESVVQEKLVEFQTQLDAAEASLHQEMEQRERLALQTASKQIKLITEKNILEVKLLEEKHKEELNLCKLQLTQAMQQIGHLQLQLQSHSNRKVEIVEKLHTVMENQWQEALRIISGNSPVVQPFPAQHATLDRNNEVYSTPSRDVRNTKSNGDCDNIPLLPVAHSSGSSTTDEEPFNKDDQLTYRPSSEVCSSEAVKLQEENPDLIKKYIQMLLNRPPGNPMTEETHHHNVETPVCESRSVPKWEKGMENHRILSANERQNFPSAAEDVKCSATLFKEMKSNKPPWK